MIRKREKGITLVALVITVIIIIILATVTINMAFGDNGLITQAQLAKDLAANSTVAEQEGMNSVLSEYLNIMGEDSEITPPVEESPIITNISTSNISTNSISVTVTATPGTSEIVSYTYSITGQEPVTVADASYTFTGLNANTTYDIQVTVTDKAGKAAQGNVQATTLELPIPEIGDIKPGTSEEVEIFDNTTKVVDDNGDEVWIPGGFGVDEESATDDEEGIVITDKKGNEFVWIPVKNDNVFKRYRGYADGSLQSISGYSEPYTGGYVTEISEYNAMEANVLEKNGFYVGRYEAGTTNLTRGGSSGIIDEVLVQKNKYVYNWIGWNNSNNMNDEKGGAVELSKNFVIKNGYASTVTSTLIYGVQWDAIMNFIDSAYSTENCNSNSFVRDSTGKGNYAGGLAKTGSNPSYAVKNIYDLAGNAFEWTMEEGTPSGRVVRGGVHASSGMVSPASSRSTYMNPAYMDVNIGFRLALYVI